MTAPWITYRRELKVLDCTVRDGGLINEHAFEDGFVQGIYRACVDAGIDYMELGYKSDKKLFARDRFGTWQFCDEDDIRRIVGDNPTPLKLAAMIDAGKSDWHTDVLPKKDSVLDMIRVAFYVTQVSEAVDMIKDAFDKGYEVSANLMAVTTAKEQEIDQALEVLAETPGQRPGRRRQLRRHVRRASRNPGEEIPELRQGDRQRGGHPRPQQSTTGLRQHDRGHHSRCQSHGRLDGRAGRGAGNCPMELLVGFLRNPKFKIRPIYQVLQEQILPLSRRLEWGPLVQYNITGQRNEHPRSAMAARGSDQRDDYVGFYDRLVNEQDM